MPSKSRKPSRRRNRRAALPRQPGRLFARPVYRYVRSVTSELLGALNFSSTSGAGITANTGNVVLSTAPSVGLSYFSFAPAFSFSDLPGVTDLAALYDLYKITRVDIELIPFDTVAAAPLAGGAAPTGGVIHSVFDYDDATPVSASLTGTQLMQQYQTYKVQQAIRPGPLKWSVKPRIAVAAYSGAFTSYANVGDLWIDVNSSLVQYYGFKFLVELSNPNSVATFFLFKLKFTYHVDCAEVR